MYKKCRLVILPTEKESNLYRTENVLRATWGFKPTGEQYTYQYLYITSNDRIKEGDWVYDIELNKIKKCRESAIFTNWKKIISTNDSSLSKINVTDCGNITCEGGIINGTNPRLCKKCNPNYVHLPQIPENFVVDYAEQFNRDNIITDVLVEYDEVLGKYSKDIHDTYFVPKVNSKDNTITIKKVKESWNREEVAILIRRAFAGVEGKYTIQKPLLINKWIEENLT